MTSVSNLVRHAEDGRVNEAMEEARCPALNVNQLIVGLKTQITTKVWWISTFGAPGPKKRPDHEITSRRHELAVLVQARDRLISGGANAARPPT